MSNKGPEIESRMILLEGLMDNKATLLKDKVESARKKLRKYCKTQNMEEQLRARCE